MDISDPLPFTDVVSELGEGPMWSAADQALYWFDVSNRRLFRQSANQNDLTTWPLEKMPGSFGFRKAGGVIAAFRNGLALGERPEGPYLQIDISIDFAKERFNDGKVDRQGRFWVGTFDPKRAPGGGSLYRLDHDLGLHRMDTGLSMSNGIAWSPDDSVMYFADTRLGCIWQYDFDVSAGTIANRRIFVDYGSGPALPDGLTVDADGFVWVAEVMIGRVARYSPDASLNCVIQLPVSRPTSVTFGGADMRTVYITSMRLGLTDRELAAEPLAGMVFSVHVDVAGQLEPEFVDR